MQTANVTATELLPVSPPNSTQSRQTRYIYYMDKAYDSTLTLLKREELIV